jgi:glycosyltransferase involved in cell wall biosynthesis
MHASNGSSTSLRLALVAPLHESVPPDQYGGTERVVSYLTEQLVARGHDVTLFASGDSRTSAKLVAISPHALRLARCVDALAPHFVSFEEVYRRARDFDLVHFHVDYLHFSGTRRECITHLTTLHSRLDLPELSALYREFADVPVVSISNAHRAPLPWLPWQGTVYHGLPDDLYRLETSPAGYLAFLGRVAPEKRLDRAIEIAGRAGMRLRIAAKIDRADYDYYVQAIKPLLVQRHVEFLGEIGEAEKQALLGGANALLFPIDWPEPFGMVMIEALACGTPVIAFRRGSVPEIIEDGVTGFICDDIGQALRAVERLPELVRATCRSEFERRFTAARMARDYIDIYRRLIDARRDHPDRGSLLHPRHKLADG